MKMGNGHPKGWPFSFRFFYSPELNPGSFGSMLNTVFSRFTELYIFSHSGIY